MHVFAQCLNDMILSRYKYYFCVVFLDGGKWKKTFCFAPRGWVLLVLKIHQENKVLGVYKFFERVYSASFLLHTR